jgi:hypothetical protein
MLRSRGYCILVYNLESIQLPWLPCTSMDRHQPAEDHHSTSTCKRMQSFVQDCYRLLNEPKTADGSVRSLNEVQCLLVHLFRILFVNLLSRTPLLLSSGTVVLFTVLKSGWLYVIYMIYVMLLLLQVSKYCTDYCYSPACEYWVLEHWSTGALEHCHTCYLLITWVFNRSWITWTLINWPPRE